MLGTAGQRRDKPEIPVRLSNYYSHSRCQGQLEVYPWDRWSSVCHLSWGNRWSSQENPPWQAEFCRKLGCGRPLKLAILDPFSSPLNQIICHGDPGSFVNCSIHMAGSCPPLNLFCVEPRKSTAAPTRPPPTTTPKPTAPPRLQLSARRGGLHCAGEVEFHQGSQGGKVEDQDLTQELGDHICSALQCGSFLRRLQDRAPHPEEPGPSLPLRWKLQHNVSCADLQQCFQTRQPEAGGRALAVLCSDFQPKVQSRLVEGHSLCEGVVEVRQGGRWAALCHNSTATAARWNEVCQEQQCGSVVTYGKLEAGKTASPGLSCPQEKLSQCHQLQKSPLCKRVFVTCQHHHPAGLGAGTVASIILALMLLALLLIMCGPLAYKKLVKKFRQKQQRQWIGPTGVNQSMSFHRNHTATVRSRAENPAASHVDNEYSQPPRSSISAYPALEGALHASSAQPDNSSDSDYDLHGAQRL
ncbi:T-cell surface glycoprotein CD5 [Echinops telfairi]|uniref:T-cell surface glycoprotein CD5 n=1 Tax=Echinops telfairi TaxID=9371 RepID=A0ABM0J599_ECHTE|nr:T-cell surface glycoprotein CD5 [Echinops telfairi]